MSGAARGARSCPGVAVALLVALAALASGACLSLPDPVHERAIEKLGAEDPIGPGALHRAGQPCGTCHGPSGPATTDFSIAGTIFAGPGSLVGVDGARIELIDAAGTRPPASAPVMTNCVGNFWIKRSVWDPVFPVRVTVAKGDTRREMKSDIGRAASCAECHAKSSADPFSKTGPVTLFPAADPDGPTKSCPVNPDASHP
jgi:cytochrome c553